MKIKEAIIYNFGKLQNRKFSFAPGINVVYGANEAGKSTLHEFLVAMLFGMEKGRGKAAGREKYMRYEPWHAPSYYSGAMRFLVGGRPFYLERNFYHKEKKEVLKNESDGEELSVAYGDLQVLLGGMRRESFEHSYDIPQSGAATGKELSELLAEYLSDAAESQDAGIPVTKAQNMLAAKRKELNQDLKRIRDKKNQEIHNLLIEKELLEKDCHTLQGNVAEAEREINHLKRSYAEEIYRKQQIKEKIGEKNQAETGKREHRVVLFSVCMIAIILNILFYGIIHYPLPVFIISEAILIVFTVTIARNSKRERTDTGEEVEIAEEDEIEESENEYHRATFMQAERMLKNLKDTLAEKETRRYNIQLKIEEKQFPDIDEMAIQTDMKALELAASEIERLSKEYYEDIQDELNATVSGLVSKLTNGKYDSVTVTTDGKLQIHSEGMELPPEALSRGTLEQIYLALRLAVGGIITKEERMPIFLDETFAMYDDMRLEQALTILSKKEEQIFIFTCQYREMELLEKLGISYHKVILE